MSSIRERIEHRRFPSKQTLFSGAIGVAISLTGGVKIASSIHDEPVSPNVPISRGVEDHKITICHNPDDHKSIEITIDKNGLKGHEHHGDTSPTPNDGCTPGEETKTPTPLPTETPTSIPSEVSETATATAMATETEEPTNTVEPTFTSTPFPQFPNCEDEKGPGDRAHFETGLHWIVGDGTLEGSDNVYNLEDGNVLQCFCPPEDKFVKGDEGIQTDFIRTDDGDKEKMPPEVFGFFRVWGPDFGLDEKWYYASGADKPSPTTADFDCNPEESTATATDTATPTNTPEPTDTPTPTDTPVPTDTPQPTDTSTATATATATATGTDTATPQATDTPRPKDTATPVHARVKTATPTRTKTSVPPTKTSSPEATETPITPTKTPQIVKGPSGMPGTGSQNGSENDLMLEAIATALAGATAVGAGLKFRRGRSQDSRSRIAAALARRR